MATKSNYQLSCTVSHLFLIFALLCTLSLIVFLLLSKPVAHPSLVSQRSPHSTNDFIKVYVVDLPRSLNYGLLDKYWSLHGDTRLKTDEDSKIRKSLSSGKPEILPYPENPLVKQYSAEYWILGDLMSPNEMRTGSFARRVLDPDKADVFYVPFFATLSAELQLGTAKGAFRKKVGNDDYARHKQVVDLVKGTEAWKRSGGRDHIFVLTDPVAMWHVRAEIAPAILLVVDFGGWYRLDSEGSNGSSVDMIQHTQVSLLKDVIVPYTHLLPRLDLSENGKRETLLYFKGAKHRHRGGIVREKLWGLLADQPGVIMEEGFPNATGREQSITGMRTSEFCLNPAGDTPTSCRLFDAIQSLCIPVIVSDHIELPFEGTIDYSEFSLFVAVSDALQPNWLLSHLRSFSKRQRDRFRQNMARIQPSFEYENGHPGGIGPVPLNGAVNHIWKKVNQKVPMIKEAVVREKRKLRGAGASAPLRCHCT